MNLKVSLWLPRIQKKPNAKCFNPSRNQLIQHMYDELLIPEWEYYYKWFKNTYGTIELIDPADYIELCADVHKTTVSTELNSCDKQRVAEYAELMAKGEVFPLCWIDMKYHSQEGRHRSLAASALGVKKIPIVIIEDWDYKAQHKELHFNKDYMFTKDAVLMNIKTDKKVTVFYKWPKSKAEAQKLLDTISISI